MITLPNGPLTWFWKLVPHRHQKALAGIGWPLGDGYLGYCKRCNLWMEQFDTIEEAREWKHSIVDALDKSNNTPRGEK